MSLKDSTDKTSTLLLLIWDMVRIQEKLLLMSLRTSKNFTLNGRILYITAGNFQDQDLAVFITPINNK